MLTTPSRQRYQKPESTLEWQLVNEYLADKGFKLADLPTIDPEEARTLMKEAYDYASSRLAEIEARSLFRRRIRYKVR